MKTYNQEENFANDALLSLYNAPGHPPDLNDAYPNIKVHFLPPNTSSLIQSIEQGIIATFKSYYPREILTLMAAATDEREYDARSFWKDFNLKLVVSIVGYGWTQFTCETTSKVLAETKMV